MLGLNQKKLSCFLISLTVALRVARLKRTFSVVQQLQLARYKNYYQIASLASSSSLGSAGDNDNIRTPRMFKNLIEGLFRITLTFTKKKKYFHFVPFRFSTFQRLVQGAQLQPLARQHQNCRPLRHQPLKKGEPRPPGKGFGGHVCICVSVF